MPNASTNIELIQMKLPRFYKKYEYKSENEKSIMYAVLNALADMANYSNEAIQRLDSAVGIDSTYGEDLYHRWGTLLGIDKRDSESYDLYRSELKLAIPSMTGGTRDAIIYAIATVIGIEKDKSLQADYIEVVDGWEYTGDVEIPEQYREFGNFICTIDMSVGEGAINVEQQIIDSINRAKASGTAFYVVYKAFKVLRYYQMDPFNYDTFDNTTYDYLGVS